MMEDIPEETITQGGQVATVSGPSHGPPNERTFKLKRRFYQCIKNGPRENEVTHTKVKLNW